MHNYKELKVWQKSRALVKEVYDFLKQLNSDEKYGLVAQIKRCVISIPSNIAEGAGRETKKDFNRFLDITLGSAFELETQVILLFDLEMVDKTEFDRVNASIQEVQRMILGLKNSMR
ncbi:four helix bundle protein [Marivirga atlantica]|jgi:four helix bundle protein|uniref:Four helix bundle protein n=1 Tax=Marivirga atlantica TaxID=1548457 RepID=A0A937AHB7_9BACT|nr:four helix bundle protein [Marivirga atlantica]MBL0763618.1 four helix bundle protein [Marivirga atlantica]